MLGALDAAATGAAPISPPPGAWNDICYPAPGGAGYCAYVYSDTTVGMNVYTTVDNALEVQSASRYAVTAQSQDTSGQFDGVEGEADYGFAGVQGTSVDGNGVYGNSSWGVGVSGFSASSYGVYGVSQSNTGVVAQSDSGYGLWATSGTGNGIFGQSTATTGYSNGVVGIGNTAQGSGVYGQTNTSGFGTYGAVMPFNTGGPGYAIYGNNPSTASGAWSGYFTGKVYAASGLYGPGGCISSAGSCTSDARLKQNIHTVVGALTDVERLRPVTYEWKQPNGVERPKGTQMGFIAQEVSK